MSPRSSRRINGGAVLNRPISAAGQRVVRDEDSPHGYGVRELTTAELEHTGRDCTTSLALITADSAMPSPLASYLHAVVAELGDHETPAKTGQ